MPDTARKLSDWISSFMLLTDNSEPPVLFRKWSAISAIASALQRKVKVVWGTSLVFYPNLYVVLVGPSATGKGTAMQFALDIMSEVPAIRMSAQATSLQALIRRLKETNLTDLDITTTEQIYHSSLTIFSKEFTVFLGYHNNELMASLCDWYDCDKRWTYETISRKKEEIIGVWVNLIAGTTPDSIQSSLPIESIGGGLTSRIIFVYEEKPAKLVVLPTQTEGELQLQQDLIHDLEKISMLAGTYVTTTGFASLWSDWCYAAFSNPPFYNKKFDGYCGRRRVHLMKLAMVINASRGDHSLSLTEEDLEAAIILLDEVEVNMGLVFKGMGKSDISSLVNDAVVFFQNSLVDDIPYWQFARYFEGNMDKFTMDRVLATLEATNAVKIINRPHTDTIIKVIDRPDVKRSKEVDA